MGRPRMHNADKPEYIVEDRGYLTPCWLWQRAISRKGYGYGHELVSENPRTWCSKTAHRMYWERRNGPAPEGLELDHLCKVRRCVNPDHLELVTHTVNVQRGDRCVLTPELRQIVAGSQEPTRVLAERYGVSYSAIGRVRRGFKGKQVRLAPFKLPWEARPEIAESDAPTKVLAAQYGITRTYVQRIRKAAREGRLSELFVS